jgi:hypothetical protein
MNKTHKLWLVWFILAAVVVTFGFLRGWTTFHKFMLAAVAVLGVLQLAGPALRGRMLRRLKGMSPEEREKFLARFDQKTQALLRKRLEPRDA